MKATDFDGDEGSEIGEGAFIVGRRRREREDEENSGVPEFSKNF